MSIEGSLNLLWMQMMHADIRVGAGLDVVGLVLPEGEVSCRSAETMSHRTIFEWKPTALVCSILLQIGCSLLIFTIHCGDEFHAIGFYRIVYSSWLGVSIFDFLGFLARTQRCVATVGVSVRSL